MSVTTTSKKGAAGSAGAGADGAASSAGRAAAAPSGQDESAAASRAAQPGLAAFVGTGPGSTELLTVRAAGLLGRADLVFAGAEVADRVRHLLPATATVRDPG